MFASSIAVIFLTLAALAGTLGAFAWAWARGLVDPHPDAARAPLDDDDLRVARPWETPLQARQRVAAHGPPLRPGPGEWGGA